MPTSPLQLAPGTVVYTEPPAVPEVLMAPPRSDVVLAPPLADTLIVRVSAPPVPEVVMALPASAVAVVPTAGPPGPQGPLGGVTWHSGQGPPGVVLGAAPGDLYLDTTTGQLYRLT